jgi:hypothetical protein
VAKRNEEPMIDFGEPDEPYYKPDSPMKTIMSQPIKVPDSVKAACASLPVLYSKRSDGKIQDWWIEVEDDKYRMASGIVNGEHVTSNWTVAVPKNAGRANATTAADQALAEAKSAWQKKRDLKYFETKAEAEQSEQFKCMLALKFPDYEDDVVYPVWCQPKLDGMRCDATVGAMVSRNGKEIVSAPHILKALAPILAEDPSLRFDGELYCNKLASDFNAIISHVRKTKPTPADLAACEESIQYWSSVSAARLWKPCSRSIPIVVWFSSPRTLWRTVRFSIPSTRSGWKKDTKDRWSELMFRTRTRGRSVC